MSENATRKILIVCVGTQDPLNQEGKDGPILSFIGYVSRIEPLKKHNPNRIYLLCTADRPGAVQATQRNAERTLGELMTRGYSDTYLKTLEVSDPTDYTQLLPEMRWVVERIKKESETDSSGGQVQYIVNVSPGTGQMEAVWLAFVNEGILKATLLQVKAPWTEADETKRVREIDFVPLFESTLIRVAQDLFGQYVFPGSSDAFVELGAGTRNEDRAEAAEYLSRLATAYNLWERFEYQKTLENLNLLLDQVAFRKNKFSTLREVVQKQRDVLNQITRHDLATQLLDIYHSARRRERIGDYVEAIWRFYTVYETLITQLAEDTLRKECALPETFTMPYDFRRFGRDNPGRAEVQKIHAKLGSPDYWPSFFDRGGAEDILNKLNREAWQIIGPARTETRWLADARHNAVHRTQPVTAEDCERAAQVVRTLIMQVFQLTTDTVNSYPFSRGTLQQVVEQLRVLT